MDEQEKKESYPECAVFKALVASRWVYEKPDGSKSIYTQQKKEAHLEKYQGHADRFINRKNSGIIGMIADACGMVNGSTVSQWFTGDKGIPKYHLRTIAKALHLDEAEKRDLYLATFFGDRDFQPRKMEDIFPPLDSQQYRDMPLSALLRSVLEICCVQTDGVQLKTLEALKEAVVAARITIKTWDEVLQESQENANHMLSYRNIKFRTRDKDEGVLGGAATSLLERTLYKGETSIELLKVLELFPLSATQLIAIAAKTSILNKEVAAINAVEPDFIFSRANLFEGGIPKHQGQILSDLRHACAVNLETGEVRFIRELFAQALVEEDAALVMQSRRLTLEDIGTKIGTTKEMVRQLENGYSGGSPTHLKRHMAQLVALFSLPPEWADIWRCAPHADGVNTRMWKVKDVNGEKKTITRGEYEELVDGYQRQIQREERYEMPKSLPLGMREVPDGLQGLRQQKAAPPREQS